MTAEQYDGLLAETSRSARRAREMLATLRPGDVVALQSTEGPELVLRGQLSVWAGSDQGVEQLVLGDSETGLILSTRSGNFTAWAVGLDLTVVSRVPRLYENSTRTVPAVGDIARDPRDGEVWTCGEGVHWTSRMGDVVTTPSLMRSVDALVLLWDGATGSLPGATS